MSTARERLYADFEDQDQQDYDPLTELGRIEVAIMGEGRMTLYGEGEAIELAMERPPLEDLGPAKELKGERAINHGSAYAPLLGIGEAQTEGDPDLDAIQDTRGLTESQIGSLMKRTNRDESRVNWHGDSVPSGGGGSGTGKAKAAKPSYGKAGAGQNADEDRRGFVNSYARRFRVKLLTPGERSFYDRRPGTALDVLRAHVVMLIADEIPPERLMRHLPTKNAGVGMDVYGLTDDEVDLLLLHPGSARRFLSEYARERDGNRIEAIDAGAERATEAA